MLSHRPCSNPGEEAMGEGGGSKEKLGLESREAVSAG
jgi:hypothetical protein